MIFITKRFGRIAFASTIRAVPEGERRELCSIFIFFHPMENETVGLCILFGMNFYRSLYMLISHPLVIMSVLRV